MAQKHRFYMSILWTHTLWLGDWERSLDFPQTSIYFDLKICLGYHENCKSGVMHDVQLLLVVWKIFLLLSLQSSWFIAPHPAFCAVPNSLFLIIMDMFHQCWWHPKLVIPVEISTAYSQAQLGHLKIDIPPKKILLHHVWWWNPCLEVSQVMGVPPGPHPNRKIPRFHGKQNFQHGPQES